MSRKLTIENMNTLAKTQGGRCLSQRYVDAHTKLHWRCSDGHEWEARPNDVKNGTWCPSCARSRSANKRRLSIDHMHALAAKRRGHCISATYVNNKTKLKWRCEHGHVWQAKPDNVRHGTWCPYCSGRAGTTIQDMQNLAATRGGQCLSKTYRGSTTKLRWRCADGHEWLAAPAAVKYQTWCPECGVGISEKICREVLRHIFGVQFPKRKPKWLVNESGNRMELDGYNEDLRLAFEYHGRQHYDFVEWFHKNQSRLTARQQMDLLKAALCEEHGVALIAIPYSIEPAETESFLRHQCKSKGIPTPNEDPVVLADLDIYSKRRLQEMRDLAAGRGGRCLSKAYINAFTKLRWRCSEGHEWEAVPSNIRNGTWCLRCAGKAKHTINDMRDLATIRGGQCLSETYVNASTKLTWRCEHGHVWDAKPNDIQQAHWCPHCARNAKHTIDQMRDLAASKGGKCLSPAYVNAFTKLKWRCERGHVWEATHAVIRTQNWCPTCAKTERRSSRRNTAIQDMRDLAQSRGGKCLSDDYVDSKTRMRWQCARGHEWQAVPSAVKGRTWCPQCAGTAKLSIQDMQHLAAEQGGVCLSKVYINNHTKLHWRCAQGHEWDAVPYSITQGHWCPHCAGRARGTIDDMTRLAARHGGVCLSSVYVNHHTNLLWRCADGHEWQATPRTVKRGAWCPTCAGQPRASTPAL